MRLKRFNIVVEMSITNEVKKEFGRFLEYVIDF